MQTCALDETRQEVNDATECNADVHLRLSALMDRYKASLLNYLVVLLGDREAALDCVQDAFVRAYENLLRGKPVNAAWLYRVGRNVAIDLFRRRARLRVERLDFDEPEALEWSPPSGDELVRRALAQLTPEDRELLYLAHVDRFRARDMAELLRIREGAVRMRLLRAHRRFVAVYGDA